METLVTNTEKQTTKSAMYEEPTRDLMERLAQLEEERTRMQTTVKLKERSQTHTELTTLAKPKVSTREHTDRNWSFIFEAYNEAGSTQLAQNLKRVQDGETTPLLAQMNEREKQLRANLDCMVTMLTCGKTLALVQLAESRHRLAKWKNGGW